MDYILTKTHVTFMDVHVTVLQNKTKQ